MRAKQDPAIPQDVFLMSTSIDTGKISGRRPLHFATIDDILTDVNDLAKAKEVRCLGNWSAGQVLKHLTIVMNGSLDGIPRAFPSVVRFLLRLFLKKRFLTKPMPAGFRLPPRAAALLPPPTTWDEGLAGIRKAIGRLKTETKREPHPVLGSLSIDEWNLLHCRHAEMHLSFLVPT
jgi:hypothetical protein